MLAINLCERTLTPAACLGTTNEASNTALDEPNIMRRSAP